MPVAGGCLTMKKECDARLFLHDAWLFLLTLVTFSYFFLLVVSFVSYFLLGLGVRFVTFCYFFTSCNFQQLLFTWSGGPG
jgi:hypothetical protein